MANTIRPPRGRDEVLDLPERFAEMGGWIGESRTNPKGSAHSQAERLAEQAGYKFYHFKDDYNVFQIGTGRALSICRWDQLPESGLQKLRNKVVEYLVAPERSEANTVAIRLGNKQFFSITNFDKAVEILEEVAGSFCTDGQKRFREFMGDTLPEPDEFPHKFEVVLASKLSGIELESVLANINERLEGKMTVRLQVKPGDES